MKNLFILTILFISSTYAQNGTEEAANLAATTLSNSSSLGEVPHLPCEACIGISNNIPADVRLQASSIGQLNKFRFYSGTVSSVCDDVTGDAGKYIRSTGTHLFSPSEAATRRANLMGLRSTPPPNYGEFRPGSDDIVRKIANTGGKQSDLNIFVPITSFTCTRASEAKCQESSYSDDRNDPNRINYPEAPCGGTITYNYKNGETLTIYTYPNARSFKQECQKAQLQITNGKGGVCLQYKSDSDTNTRNDRLVSPPVELDFCLSRGFLGTEQACVGEPIASPNPEPEPASVDCCKNGAAGSKSLCTNNGVPGYTDFTFHIMECTGTGTWGGTLAILDCDKKVECCDVDQYKVIGKMCYDYVWEYGRP